MPLERGQDLIQAPKSEFVAMLEKRWSQGHFLCVGLDSDRDKITKLYGLGQFAFNKEIVDVTNNLVCAYL